MSEQFEVETRGQDTEKARSHFAAVLGVPCATISDRALLYLSTYGSSDEVARSLWGVLTVYDVVVNPLIDWERSQHQSATADVT